MGVADLLSGLLPRPTVDAHACSRRLGSGCSVCVDACPKQALHVADLGGRDDHAPVVDPLLCVGCGLCESRCPTLAISGVGPSPELIVTAARGTHRLRLRCEVARTSGARLDAQPPIAAGLDVGCLASLHPETVAASAGALSEQGVMELLRGDCDRCPMAAGAAVESMVSEARACLGVPGRIRVGVVHDAGEPVESAQRPTARMSRRSLFRVASPKRAAEDAVAAGSSSRGDQTPRKLVLQSLPQPALPRPRAASGCTGCCACVNICPSEALSFTVSDDVFELSVAPSACVGCGECSRVCPEDVLSPAGRVPNLELTLLATVVVAHCDSCGMPLSPGEKRSCAVCSSRRSLASDVWTQYGL